MKSGVSTDVVLRSAMSVRVARVQSVARKPTERHVVVYHLCRATLTLPALQVCETNSRVNIPTVI